MEAFWLSVQSSFHKTFVKIVQVVPETLLCCSAIFCCWFLMFASLEVVAGITESAKFSFPVSVVEEVTCRWLFSQVLVVKFQFQNKRAMAL